MAAKQCQWLHVAITTASIDLSSIMPRRFVQVFAFGYRRFADATRPSSGSQRPAMLTPGILLNGFINCPARLPQLMKPRLISSLALAA